MSLRNKKNKGKNNYEYYHMVETMYFGDDHRSDHRTR